MAGSSRAALAASVIGLAHGEESMRVDDHVRGGDDDILCAAAWADGSFALVPEVFYLGVGEKPVAVGAATGSVGSFSVACHPS